MHGHLNCAMIYDTCMSTIESVYYQTDYSDDCMIGNLLTVIRWENIIHSRAQNVVMNGIQSVCDMT